MIYWQGLVESLDSLADDKNVRMLCLYDNEEVCLYNNISYTYNDQPWSAFERLFGYHIYSSIAIATNFLFCIIFFGGIHDVCCVCVCVCVYVCCVYVCV